MAYIRTPNNFDPEIAMSLDTDRQYDVGDPSCFTDNKMIADIKKWTASFVPGATVGVSVSGYGWSSSFAFDVEYSVFHKNIYAVDQGFRIKVTYCKETSGGDRYTFYLMEYSAKAGWHDIYLPNKAKAFLKEASASTHYLQNSDKHLIFVNPAAETIKKFVDAMITPNRRKALTNFIEEDHKWAMEAANAKNLIAIEAMDVEPVVKELCMKYYMGIPTIEETPNCRQIILLSGQYGAKLKLLLFKEHMQFDITHGSDYTSDRFETNFIKMLYGHLEYTNLDIRTQIKYADKDKVFELLGRIGDLYKQTRLATYALDHNIDPVWKRNPGKE